MVRLGYKATTKFNLVQQTRLGHVKNQMAYHIHPPCGAGEGECIKNNSDLVCQFIMSRETSAHKKSGWLEIFVVTFFDWSIFGKYRFRLVRWKCCVFF